MSNNRDKLKERIEEGAIGGGVIGLAIGAPYAGAVLGASGQVIYHAYEVSGVKDTVCGMFRRCAFSCESASVGCCRRAQSLVQTAPLPVKPLGSPLPNHVVVSLRATGDVLQLLPPSHAKVVYSTNPTLEKQNHDHLPANAKYLEIPELTPDRVRNFCADVLDGLDYAIWDSARYQGHFLAFQGYAENKIFIACLVCEKKKPWKCDDRHTHFKRPKHRKNVSRFLQRHSILDEPCWTQQSKRLLFPFLPDIDDQTKRAELLEQLVIPTPPTLSPFLLEPVGPDDARSVPSIMFNDSLLMLPVVTHLFPEQGHFNTPVTFSAIGHFDNYDSVTFDDAPAQCISRELGAITVLAPFLTQIAPHRLEKQDCNHVAIARVYRGTEKIRNDLKFTYLADRSEESRNSLLFIPIRGQSQSLGNLLPNNATPNFLSPETPATMDLPCDILSATFSYLHLRPRLLVVSLVCKRWRHAVLQCPTQLSDRYLTPERSVQMLPLMSRFLSLNSLKLSSPQLAQKLFDSQYSPRTSLRALSLIPTDVASATKFAQCFIPVASGLHELSLSQLTADTIRLMQGTSSLLHTLKLKLDTHALAAVPQSDWKVMEIFLTQRASQLVNLTLCTEMHIFSVLGVTSFPLLQSMTLRMQGDTLIELVEGDEEKNGPPVESGGDPIIRIDKAATQLFRKLKHLQLDLRQYQVVEELPDELLESVTFFKLATNVVPPPLTAGSLNTFLSRCSKLVSFIAHGEVPLYLTRLKNLRASDYIESDLSSHKEWPHLHKLEYIPYARGLQSVFAGARFPVLETVQWKLQDFSNSQHLAELLCASPRLVNLVAVLPPISTLDQLKLVNDFVHLAETRGIETLKLITSGKYGALTIENNWLHVTVKLQP